MNQHQQDDAERLLTRAELAQILTGMGYPVAQQTLAKYACIGGGPEFQMYGRLPRYTLAKGIEWAKSRLSKPVKTRSELQGCESTAAPKSAA